MNRSRVAALDHEPVVGAVPGVAARIFGERNSRRDVGTGVFLVVQNLRQLVKIDLVAGQDHLFHRSFGDELWRDRFFHGAEIGALHLLGLGMDRRRQSRASGMKVGQHGKLRAFDFFEKDNRPPLGFLLELHSDRGDLECRIDFAGDSQKVFRVILFDQIEIATQVLRHCLCPLLTAYLITRSGHDAIDERPIDSTATDDADGFCSREVRRL